MEGHPLFDLLAPLVDRRSLLRLGLSERTIDHCWRNVPLVRIKGDSKSYARREDVLSVIEDVRR